MEKHHTYVYVKGDSAEQRGNRWSFQQMALGHLNTKMNIFIST